jgi:hypothetical protein
MDFSLRMNEVIGLLKCYKHARQPKHTLKHLDNKVNTSSIGKISIRNIDE